MSMHWLRSEWPAPPGVLAGTTFRSGGRSTGVYESLNLAAHVDDDANIVNANRQQFIEHCGLPAAPSWICQVHGTRVAIDPLPGEYPEADAIVSRQRQTVCAVLTADCLPVVFCDLRWYGNCGCARWLAWAVARRSRSGGQGNAGSGSRNRGVAWAGYFAACIRGRRRSPRAIRGTASSVTAVLRCTCQ